MNSPRLGVVTGTQLGSAFIDGLADGLAVVSDQSASLSLLMGLHPSQAPVTVGYADVLHLNGSGFDVAAYFTSTRSDEFADKLIAAELDFLMVVSLSQLVPSDLITRHTVWRDHRGGRSYRRACIGAHPTCLPIGRGRAPIPWTILKGLTESAVTTFVLDDGADDGPILDRHAFEVAAGATAIDLYAKVKELHAVAGACLARPLSAGELFATPQDHSLATQWPKRTASDAHISSASCVGSICRLVAAAQPPYSSPFLVIREHRLDIAHAEPIASTSQQTPGSLLQITTSHVDLSVATGAVRLFAREGVPSELLDLSLTELLIP